MAGHAKRFSFEAVMKSKHKMEKLKIIFQRWIVLLGPPNQILQDTVAEFNNELLKEMSDQLKVFVRSTAVESLCHNGITKRHNVISGNMISKLLFDESNKFFKVIIVALAVSAKAALHNCYEYNPDQFVFGTAVQIARIWKWNQNI